jgi:hypothetical protein
MAEGPVAKYDNSIDEIQVSISIFLNETYIGDFLVFSFVFGSFVLGGFVFRSLIFGFVFRSLVLGGFVLGSVVSSDSDGNESGKDDEL